MSTLDRLDDLLTKYRIGPLFTPPSIVGAEDGTDGTLSLPHLLGGANWEGSAERGVGRERERDP